MRNKSMAAIFESRTLAAPSEVHAGSGPASCPLCGSAATGDPHSLRKDRWTYLRCVACEGVSLFPVPDGVSLAAYYNQSYSVPLRNYLRAMSTRSGSILSDIGGWFPRQGTLLEIGCSYGGFLNAARTAGWKTAGIELDDRAARYARETLGLNVQSGTLDDAVTALQPPYDVIVALHVIEHVPAPIAFLRRCHELLAPGGILFLKTPNIGSWIAARTGSYWQWLSPPAHIHLFSSRSIASALKASGFQPQRISSQRGDAENNLFEMISATGRYAVSRKASDAAGGPARTGRMDHWYVKAVRLMSEIIYYPFSITLDRRLGRKCLQPELVAVAQAL